MALGFMRRHRRWLYGFLWLVIVAFIILYIPAFQGASEQGAGATLVEVGSMPITVGEYQKAYVRQREMYLSMYQGRLDNEQLKRMGLEEQTLQSLIDDRVLQLEARRLGISVDDETLPPAPGHRARVPGRRPLHGRRRAAAAPGDAGRVGGGVRAGAAPAHPARARGLARHGRRDGEPEGGGGRVPAPQRAAEGGVRHGARGGLQRRRHRRRGARALRREQGPLRVPGAPRPELPPARPAEARSRASPSPTPRSAPTTTRTRTSSSSPSRSARATSW